MVNFHLTPQDSSGKKNQKFPEKKEKSKKRKKKWNFCFLVYASSFACFASRLQSFEFQKNEILKKMKFRKYEILKKMKFWKNKIPEKYEILKNTKFPKF